MFSESGFWGVSAVSEVSWSFPDRCAIACLRNFFSGESTPGGDIVTVWISLLRIMGPVDDDDDAALNNRCPSPNALGANI